MAITNIRQQVAADFRDKVALEFALQKELKALDRRMVNSFRASMMRGMVPRADDQLPQMTNTLVEHYQKVVAKFEGRIDDQTPDEVSLTPDEKAVLAAALTTYISGRAPEQASIILNTTQSEMQASATIANQSTEDQIERALVASALLSRRLVARRGTIAALETQAPAEATKSAEYDTMAGRTPLSSERPEEDLNKEWVTLGDEVVRPTHVLADSQVQPIDKPFSVGGQMLRFPGDTTLGATIGNVANCRCSAVYDTGAVAAMRIRKGQAPQFDPVASPTLMVSMDA